MRQTMSGNITIEASVIVPTILIVLATMILASLLLHDVYVIRTNNTMNADARVIAGEHTRGNQGPATFIIKAKYKMTNDKKITGHSVVTEVVGGQTIQPFGLSFAADESREYGVKSPKKMIRMVDFVDDATDMWTGTREIKDQVDQEIESIEVLLTGSE